MMKKMALSAIVAGLALSAGSASATYSVNILDQATPGVAGYTTYTFEIVPTGTITSSQGGFTAPTMRQVNPLAAVTVFGNSNAFFGFVGEDVLADSQFEFNTSTDGNPNFLVAIASESATHLESAFTGFAPKTLPFNLAHVVIPTLDQGDYTIVMIEDGQEIAVSGAFGNVPEPATIALLGLGGLALLGARRRKA